MDTAPICDISEPMKKGVTLSNRTSRRELLGAAVAVPLALRSDAAAGQDSHWAAAVLRYRSTREALRSIDAAAVPGVAGWTRDTDAEYFRRYSAAYQALAALVDTPSPDAAAIAFKSSLDFDENRLLEAVRADFNRIFGNEAKLEKAGLPVGKKEPIQPDSAAINVLDAFTPSQVAAVRGGKPASFLADAINEVLAHAGRSGRAVMLPAGAYDLQAPLQLPPNVWLRGECPGFPAPDYNPGIERKIGTLLFNNHRGDCINVVGSGPYAVSGGIENLVISGDGKLHASGNGIVIDKVGGYRIREVRIFSTPGDALVLGTSAEDVTGQIHLEGIYINNPGGICIRNRSRWLKARQIETDGGTYSYFATDAAQTSFDQFHFEGALKKGVSIGGGSKNSAFNQGFIGMTYPGSDTAVQLRRTPGNTDITFDTIQIVGHGSLRCGIAIEPEAWRTRIINCTIEHCPTGIRDESRGSMILGNSFTNCGTPIEARGNESVYKSNSFLGTIGAYSIAHFNGNGGNWSGNVTDKPFHSYKTATEGDFGTNVVKDNSGYKKMVPIN